MIRSITFLSKFLMKSMAAAFFMAIAVPVLRAQDCKTSFELFNVSDAKVASATGVRYRFKLENQTNGEQTYTLSVEDLVLKSTNKECKLKFARLDDFYLKPMGEGVESMNREFLIQVPKKETLIFYVHLVVEAVDNAQNKAKITLKSKDCPDFEIEKILTTTFIPGM